LKIAGGSARRGTADQAPHGLRRPAPRPAGRRVARCCAGYGRRGPTRVNRCPRRPDLTRPDLTRPGELGPRRPAARL